MSGRCEDMRAKLEIMLHADLPAEELPDIERHLAECPGCREYRAALIEDDRLLTGFTRSMDETISRMEEGIMGSIDGNAGRDNISGRRQRRLFGGPAGKIAVAAAAALVLVVGWNLIFRSGPGEVAWSTVIAQVREAQDYICRIDRVATPWDSVEMVAYFSEKYGQKKVMYKDGKLAAEVFVRPGDDRIHLLHHLDEAYVTIGISSEEAKNLTDLTSARDLVDYFRSFDYREIGVRDIDGVAASGIEVDDPAMWAGQYEKGWVKLWVDSSTLWPVLIEREFSSDDGEVRVRETYSDFRWNPALEKEDFEFEVPEEYGTLDFGEARTGEEGAIEGLRAYAKLSGGRYPGDPSFDTAASEIREDRDRLQADGRWGPEEIKELFKLRDFCSFYAGLVRSGVEVEYNGDSVTALDFEEVLMRWKLEGGGWRVIYGDLRVETLEER